jgi:hypothetical protein
MGAPLPRSRLRRQTPPRRSRPTPRQSRPPSPAGCDLRSPRACKARGNEPPRNVASELELRDATIKNPVRDSCRSGHHRHRRRRADALVTADAVDSTRPQSDTRNPASVKRVLEHGLIGMSPTTCRGSSPACRGRVPSPRARGSSACSGRDRRGRRGRARSGPRGQTPAISQSCSARRRVAVALAMSERFLSPAVATSRKCSRAGWKPITIGLAVPPQGTV